MFSFLKDKVKSAISSITKKFEDEGEVVETKQEESAQEEEKYTPKTEEETEQKGKLSLEKELELAEEYAKSDDDSPKEQEKDRSEKVKKIRKEFDAQPSIAEKEQKKIVREEEKKGFFAKVTAAITTKKISASQFDELFWDLEVELLENNVAFEVIEKIKQDLKEKLVDTPLKRGEVEKIILTSLQESISEILDFPSFDLLTKVKEKKPYIIVFIGINGSGKTTTIAKVAHFLKKNNLSCVLAAGDTFRAASIHQLEEQAKRVGVKVIKHDYNTDPSAVCFDAIKHAQQKNIDVVLIDTAGRQHSNTNLMDEMKKIIRVSKPDLKIYIGEMIAGNDCIEQIRNFDEAVHIDGVILSKSEIDEKGGTAISVSYVTKKPIYFLGTGQELDDLKPFEKEDLLKKIFA